MNRDPLEWVEEENECGRCSRSMHTSAPEEYPHDDERVQVTPMDIGQPKRIIEISPDSVPLPDEVAPDLLPEPEPVTAPAERA